MSNEVIDMQTGEVIGDRYADDAVAIRRELDEFKACAGKACLHMLRVGRMLCEVHRKMGQGRPRNAPPKDEWLEWLGANLALKETNAKRMMRAAREFGESEHIAKQLDMSAAYLLARPSTPHEAKDKAMECIARGEYVTHELASEFVKELRPDADDEPWDLDETVERLFEANRRVFARAHDDCRAAIPNVLRGIAKRIEKTGSLG